MVKGDRNEVSRTNVLTKHDSQVLDGEETELYRPQAMAFTYKVRWVCGLAPTLAF